MFEKLKATYDENVRAGRERFGVPEGTDDSKASYHKTKLSEEYAGTKTPIVNVDVKCDGFTPDGSQVKNFSLYASTRSFAEKKGGFPTKSYETELTKSLNDRYKLVSIHGDKSDSSSYLDRNTLTYAPKDKLNESEFCLELKNDYTEKNGPLEYQTITLVTTEPKSVESMKYVTNAIHKAIGLG